MSVQATSLAQNETIQRYYKIHAAIYDLTRWTFLLGRTAILKRLPLSSPSFRSLWEVGCGTGYNLRWLAHHYPTLQLHGVDVSEDMLAVAEKNLQKTKNGATLHKGSYQQNGLRPKAAPDAILFSYALTMFNPGWEEAILCAKDDLATGGRIAIVDFHNSPLQWFKRWMGFNHVRMDSHLLPFLQQHFSTEYVSVKKAYFGFWQYVLFIGIK